ncbi:MULTISPECIES: transporter associated domain-containing protein [Pseudovibrio]|uniref:transporter associated domain-containing protein n=1 Tax=Stappiaceae TaxID=2821832 RepID=UPI002365CAF5|nr:MULTISPECIES: hemolysin family protein [Pseudovibrio]MDD7909677.1 hemolysin family protein [Pseudovibrio exalbescens]MDX5592019.1 hemolysin family protein [Pseudovibrio sp. SPO723]
MTGSEPRSTEGGTASEGSEKTQDASPRATLAADDASEPPETKPGFFAGLGSAFKAYKKNRRGKSGSLRENLEDELSRESVDADNDSFTASERELLANILQLRESRVEDVMIPRADIEAVEDTIPIADLMEYFRESGHSRMPVYHENLDDPRGMVHIKDLMSYMAEEAGMPKRNGKRKNGERLENGNGKDTVVPEMDLGRIDLSRPLFKTGLIRPLHFVPPSMSSLDLMKQMQVTRVQMALVIDEYGGTDGLVSLEDIVETVVGDIEDEHDEAEEAMITTVRDGVWAVDPRIDLEDLEEEIKTGWEIGELTEDVDTLGGLLFTLLGRVPVRGELISDRHLPGYEFEVMDADPRRIKRLKIYRRRQEQRAGLVRNRTKRAEAAE